MKRFFSVVFCLFFMVSHSQEIGTITGILSDKEISGQPLSFANVLIKGTSMGAMTDFDGLYKIENIPLGTYTVVFSFVGYKTVEVPNVNVESNKVTEINTGLEASAAALDQVVITTVARKDSEVALLLEQKGAIEIKESIGSVELAKLGIGDVATATSRISGVTTSESSGNLYVRGLGDRYLYSTMNGLPIPSDDVERKNINLELFPTRVVQNVSISKTYSSKTSADQVSGNINISTRELSGKSEFGAGVSTGFNTNSVQKGVGDNFKQTPNINDVNFGFYSKEMPTRDALTRQGWDPESTSMPINYEYTLTAGKRVSKKFEILFTGAHSSKQEYREGVFRQYRRNFINNSFDDVQEWITTIESTALLNLGYEFNDNHSLRVVSLFINKLSDKVYEAGRSGDGFVFEETNPAEGLSQFRRDQNTRQTRLWINQFIGEHAFGEKNKLEWAVGYNIVDADEPNRIRNEVNFNEDIIQLGQTGGFQQRKSTQEIDDGEWNARLKDNFVVFEKDSTSLGFAVGGNYRNKQRDFSSRFFGVQKSSANLPAPTSLDMLSDVFTQENLENGFLQINQTQEDTYDAEMITAAGFASVNYSINKFVFNIGARYQNDQLTVNYDIGNTPAGSTFAEKSYDNIYPSVNIKYSLNERNNFRIAGSKTITLPEFKEIAPFEYVSPTGRVTRGNPDLEASTAFNMDLKWEFFPTTKELISLTGFYKKIEDPINRVQARGSAGVFSYFNAGEKAEIYGLELDANFSLISSENNAIGDLDLGLNTTKMWHSQDLKESRDQQGNLSTFRYKNLSEVDLQGASDWIFNASLNFASATENQFLASVSATYASDKVYALGSPEIQTQSDVYYNDAIVEEGFVTLNAVLSQELNDNLKLKFSAENLLDPEIKHTQLINPSNGVEKKQTVKSYKKGIVFSIGASYSF